VFREEIESNNDRFCAALRLRDLDALMALYDEDVALLVPGSPPIEGLDDVRAYYEGIFGAGVTAASLRSTKLEDVGEAVVELGVYSMSVEPPDAETFEGTGKYLHVLRRQPDGRLAIWKDIFQPDGSA
jgi:ketosteroid isomerase-like protein